MWCYLLCSPVIEDQSHHAPSTSQWLINSMDIHHPGYRCTWIKNRQNTTLWILRLSCSHFENLHNRGLTTFLRFFSNLNGKEAFKLRPTHANIYVHRHGDGVFKRTACGTRLLHQACSTIRFERSHALTPPPKRPPEVSKIFYFRIEIGYLRPCLDDSVTGLER